MIEQDTHSIVVAGDMNPKIFQPLWFAKQELLSESEAEASNVKLIHPDIAAFSTEWLELQVTRERFIVKTKMEAYFEPLRDLTIGTFSLLSHTPLKAVGINFERHVSVKSGSLEELTNRFAPKNFWEDKGIEAQFVEIVFSINKPSIEYPHRFLRIKIQPSGLIKDGLFLDFNYHTHLATNPNDLKSGGELVVILEKDWASMKDEIDELTQTIIR